MASVSRDPDGGRMDNVFERLFLVETMIAERISAVERVDSPGPISMGHHAPARPAPYDKPRPQAAWSRPSPDSDSDDSLPDLDLTAPSDERVLATTSSTSGSHSNQRACRPSNDRVPASTSSTSGSHSNQRACHPSNDRVPACTSITSGSHSNQRACQPSNEQKKPGKSDEDLATSDRRHINENVESHRETSRRHKSHRHRKKKEGSHINADSRLGETSSKVKVREPIVPESPQGCYLVLCERLSEAQIQQYTKPRHRSRVRVAPGAMSSSSSSSSSDSSSSSSSSSSNSSSSSTRSSSSSSRSARSRNAKTTVRRSRSSRGSISSSSSSSSSSVNSSDGSGSESDSDSSTCATRSSSRTSQQEVDTTDGSLLRFVYRRSVLKPTEVVSPSRKRRRDSNNDVRNRREKSDTNVNALERSRDCFQDVFSQSSDEDITRQPLKKVKVEKDEKVTLETSYEAVQRSMGQFKDVFSLSSDDEDGPQSGRSGDVKPSLSSPLPRQVSSPLPRKVSSPLPRKVSSPRPRADSPLLTSSPRTSSLPRASHVESPQPRADHVASPRSRADHVESPRPRADHVKSPRRDGQSKASALCISSDSDFEVVRTCTPPRERICLPEKDGKKGREKTIPTAIVKPIPRVPVTKSNTPEKMLPPHPSVSEMVRSLQPSVKLRRLVSPILELVGKDGPQSSEALAVGRGSDVEMGLDVSDVTIKSEPIGSGYGDVKVGVESARPDVIVDNDVIIIDDDVLPDLLPIPEAEPETEVVPESPVARIQYWDCLEAVPCHGHCVAINDVTPLHRRLVFTHDQCSSIEGCLEETSDQNFLGHSLWWVDYAIIEREMSTKFTRRIAYEVMVASETSVLATSAYRSLCRSLRIHPPLRKTANDGEDVGSILSHLGTVEDSQSLLNYGLMLNYTVLAFQAEFFTRKLLDSRDLKRSVVQKEFSSESSTSHRHLKTIIKNLSVLPRLAQLNENVVYLSPRAVFSAVSRILEMVVLTSPKPIDTIDRICESLIDYTKDQPEDIKNIVFGNLTSSVLANRFISRYQNWSGIEDVVASVKRSTNAKTMARVCLYLETAVTIARGKLNDSLSQRLLAKRTESPDYSPVIDQLPFTKRQLEKILRRVEKSVSEKPELESHFMRLDILMESVFET